MLIRDSRFESARIGLPLLVGGHGIGRLAVDDEVGQAVEDRSALVDQALRLGLEADALVKEIFDTLFRVDEHGNPTTGFPTGSEFYESVVGFTFNTGRTRNLKFVRR